MPGETTHIKGREGVWRAKRWLERTGTAEVLVTSDLVAMSSVLEVPIERARVRSFDLHGVYGSPRRFFFAEVKHYEGPVGGQSYDEFLATAYCKAREHDGATCDFMFITWHPFLVKSWRSLRTAARVREAIRARRDWLPDVVEVSDDLCESVAARLWLIVLSDKSSDLQLPLATARQLFALMPDHADPLGIMYPGAQE
ncbi:MAG TPA: hypothetical protein VFB78_15075 [Acidimicrobiales bacterium]|nr:hypothetical protein [Acidimicrobiales bacterium]